uniref:Uncharacterized protein conserved in bacteria n=1 Tax=uncultured alpha proteobacterium HF0010_13E22 TaxID=710801 RepID=E0XR22_9PROT|nr:uncharacterized protein conserved in bacteria [uncultured alpha proteobacterium HF0010_13E22]
MIKYQLICDKSHEFEGWFGGSAAFESQQESGLLTCPVCGSADVRRALMAPNLASPKTRKTELAEQQPSAQPEPQPQPQATQQASAALPPAAARKMQELMSEMRALQTRIREECRDVGNDFAEEARKIHYGEVEPGGIYGQATAEEREALDEEGIEIMDMPWLPKDN